MTDFSATIAQIKALSVEDRLRLVEAIWDTIAEDPDQVRLTEAQKQELDRRIADMEANPDDCIPWEEVYAQSMRRVQR
jgi:putative addiction module component (TIGR02574 family)